jgi:proteasome lid subunit RPN8/RPN11
MRSTSGQPAEAASDHVLEEASLGSSTLFLGDGHLREMIAHCLRCFPEEGCGLLVGPVHGERVSSVHPVANVASSAQVFRVDPVAHLRIDREAEADGQGVVGVFHSHTHTDAWPSPTDVEQAVDPSWHFVVVSLRLEVPSVRSFRIVAGKISEEQVVVTSRKI